MGRLPRYDERPVDGTEQAARAQDGQGRGNFASADGEVCNSGDRAGIQGRLRDISASWWRQSWDRGWDTCYAPPMGTALPRGGLVVPPQLCTKEIQRGEPDNSDL